MHAEGMDRPELWEEVPLALTARLLAMVPRAAQELRKERQLQLRREFIRRVVLVGLCCVGLLLVLLGMIVLVQLPEVQLWFATTLQPFAVDLGVSMAALFTQIVGLAGQALNDPNVRTPMIAMSVAVCALIGLEAARRAGFNLLETV